MMYQFHYVESIYLVVLYIVNNVLHTSTASSAKATTSVNIKYKFIIKAIHIQQTRQAQFYAHKIHQNLQYIKKYIHITKFKLACTESKHKVTTLIIVRLISQEKATP